LWLQLIILLFLKKFDTLNVGIVLAFCSSCKSFCLSAVKWFLSDLSEWSDLSEMIPATWHSNGTLAQSCSIPSFESLFNLILRESDRTTAVHLNFEVLLQRQSVGWSQAGYCWLN